MMECADRNANVAGAEREKVCAREFKNLRLSAFKDELLYHSVNERFFTNEAATKNNQSPF